MESILAFETSSPILSIALSTGKGPLIEKDVKVRLWKEEPTDGQIMVGANIMNFQLCERLREGRERHREYKELEKVGRSEFQPYRPASNEEALDWIMAAIKAKDEKYGIKEPLNLLVYVDFDYIKIRVKSRHRTFHLLRFLDGQTTTHRIRGRFLSCF